MFISLKKRQSFELDKKLDELNAGLTGQMQILSELRAQIESLRMLTVSSAELTGRDSQECAARLTGELNRALENQEALRGEIESAHKAMRREIKSVHESVNSLKPCISELEENSRLMLIYSVLNEVPAEE